MNPLDAFRRAMFFISGVCSSITLNKPGAVIERLSPEARQALQQLKSSDIDGSESSERIDDLAYYGSEEYYQNKKFEKDKLEFDKRMKK